MAEPPHPRTAHRRGALRRAPVGSSWTPRGQAAGGSRSPSRSALGTVVLVLAITYTVAQRHRRVGQQHPGGLGLRDHQLRVVDRHRPRGHVHLGHPAPARAAVAHEHQPLRRGDDPLRRRAGGPVPAPAPRAAVVRLLARPLSGDHAGLAAVQERAAVGRGGGARPTSRSRSLFWYVGLVPDLAALRDRAPEPRPPRRLRRLRRSAGAARRAHLSALPRSLYGLLAGLATPLVLSVHIDREQRLRDRRSCPAGTPPSSRRSSSPAPSSPASRWC